MVLGIEVSRKQKRGRRESREGGKYHSSDQHVAASATNGSIILDNFRDANYTTTSLDSMGDRRKKRNVSADFLLFSYSHTGVDSPTFFQLHRPVLKATIGAQSPRGY